MIYGMHPILTALQGAPFTFHLIGSRYAGKFTEASDWDFLAVAKDHDEWQQLREWLKGQGFRVQGDDGYGPDKRLFGTNAWTWLGNGQHPGVDVLPVDPEEAAFRLRWLKSMKDVGDESGLIAKGLKAEKAWALLWSVLAKFDAEGKRNAKR